MARLSSNIVSLTLSRPQALVLFDLLARYQESGSLEIHDTAEGTVLRDICGVLEKNLDEPFADDYAQLLEIARTRVRGSAV